MISRTCIFRHFLSASCGVVIAASLLAHGTLLSAESTAQNPCGLLEASEVEAVLGEPLASPPFRASSGTPDPQGGSCRYETAAFRAIELRAEWRNGGDTFGLMNMLGGNADAGGAKGVLTLPNGNTVRGEWDEAGLFMCCEFSARRGDQLLVLDVAGSQGTIEQAAFLANLALQRSEQPLAVDDAAAVAAANDRSAQRPKPRSACELVTRREAEALIGTSLAAEPEGNQYSCTYAWSPSGAGYQEQLTLRVTWRGGFAEMRRTRAAIGQALSFLDAEGLPTEHPQPGSTLIDEAGSSIVDVSAVRKDVMLSIETGGMGNGLATEFIATAAPKL